MLKWRDYSDHAGKQSHITLQEGGREIFYRETESKSNTTKETENRVTPTGAKEGQQPPEARSGKGQILPWSFQRQCVPGNTLILTK